MMETKTAVAENPKLIAVFKNIKTDELVEIIPSTDDDAGFIRKEDGTEVNISRRELRKLEDRNRYICVEVCLPHTYHVWHFCTCENCSTKLTGISTRIGGKIFDHSQGSWNSHLRFVPIDAIFTFNMPK